MNKFVLFVGILSAFGAHAGVLDDFILLSKTLESAETLRQGRVFRRFVVHAAEEANQEFKVIGPKDFELLKAGKYSETSKNTLAVIEKRLYEILDLGDAKVGTEEASHILLTKILDKEFSIALQSQESVISTAALTKISDRFAKLKQLRAWEYRLNKASDWTLKTAGAIGSVGLVGKTGCWLLSYIPHMADVFSTVSGGGNYVLGGALIAGVASFSFHAGASHIKGLIETLNELLFGNRLNLPFDHLNQVSPTLEGAAVYVKKQLSSDPFVLNSLAALEDYQNIQRAQFYVKQMIQAATGKPTAQMALESSWSILDEMSLDLFISSPAIFLKKLRDLEGPISDKQMQALVATLTSTEAELAHHASLFQMHVAALMNYVAIKTSIATQPVLDAMGTQMNLAQIIQNTKSDIELPQIDAKNLDEFPRDPKQILIDAVDRIIYSERDNAELRTRVRVPLTEAERNRIDAYSKYLMDSGI